MIIVNFQFGFMNVYHDTRVTHLERDSHSAADLSDNGGSHRCGGVALVAVELDHRALTLGQQKDYEWVLRCNGKKLVYEAPAATEVQIFFHLVDGRLNKSFHLVESWSVVLLVLLPNRKQET